MNPLVVVGVLAAAGLAAWWAFGGSPAEPVAPEPTRRDGERGAARQAEVDEGQARGLEAQRQGTLEASLDNRTTAADPHQAPYARRPDQGQRVEATARPFYADDRTWAQAHWVWETLNWTGAGFFYQASGVGAARDALVLIDEAGRFFVPVLMPTTAAQQLKPVLAYWAKQEIISDRTIARRSRRGDRNYAADAGRATLTTPSQGNGDVMGAGRGLGPTSLWDATDRPNGQHNHKSDWFFRGYSARYADRNREQDAQGWAANCGGVWSQHLIPAAWRENDSAAAVALVESLARRHPLTGRPWRCFSFPRSIEVTENRAWSWVWWTAYYPEHRTLLPDRCEPHVGGGSECSSAFKRWVVDFHSTGDAPADGEPWVGGPALGEPSDVTRQVVQGRTFLYDAEGVPLVKDAQGLWQRDAAALAIRGIARAAMAGTLVTILNTPAR